jgi:L-ascorbate metabolism protein UlaG (beta-lactamase superfamily)/predicted small lipoprotein YifL
MVRKSVVYGAFVLVLVVLMLVGCGRGGPADVPPEQQPTATPAEVATPTPESAPEPGSTDELPKLLDHLHALGHASFRLDGPPTIYFDPTSAGSDAPPADVILISHEHNDHYAPAAIKQLSTADTVILTNERVAAKLEKVSGVEGTLQVIQPGEEATIGEVTIETVPAYNLTKSYHPREAGGLGFIVTWQGERLYFAGDTDHIPEMADIACDVALLPIGGTYTMDVGEAAQAAADMEARVYVPMHARSADPAQFLETCDCTAVIVEP